MIKHTDCISINATLKNANYDTLKVRHDEHIKQYRERDERQKNELWVVFIYKKLWSLYVKKP